ncbi:MAG: helix-turn-helix transcriptional regulator [Bacteroidota bacterium]
MESLVHHDISDLYKTLGLHSKEQTDFTILNVTDIHPEVPFKSPKLRADYFSFILTKNGSGVYYLDDNKFPFHSRMIYFTNPGHIKSYELHESKEGYIIISTESFLKEYVHAEIYDEFPFLLAEIVPPKTLSEQELKSFETLYSQILDEFDGSSPNKNKIMGSLFKVLLLKIKEAFWSDYSPIMEGNRNSQIVKSFKQLLEEEFKSIVTDGMIDRRSQIKDFADKLNLHPNYLNSVIKSKTGKTINDWMISQTLSSAKSLLKNTSLSAKEIAYKLGFTEPTHFNRFFKQHLETTPGEFRKGRVS